MDVLYALLDWDKGGTMLGRNTPNVSESSPRSDGEVNASTNSSRNKTERPRYLNSKSRQKLLSRHSEESSFSGSIGMTFSIIRISLPQ